MTRQWSADDRRQVTDVVAYVREHPEMYRHLVSDVAAVAAALTEVALRGGSTEIGVRLTDGWCVFHSAGDWHAALNGRDPFTEIVSCAGLGPNAMFPEVALTAFSSALTTVTRDGVRVLKGEPPPLDALIPDPVRHGRWIVYKPPA